MKVIKKFPLAVAQKKLGKWIIDFRSLLPFLFTRNHFIINIHFLKKKVKGRGRRKSERKKNIHQN